MISGKSRDRLRTDILSATELTSGPHRRNRAAVLAAVKDAARRLCGGREERPSLTATAHGGSERPQVGTEGWSRIRANISLDPLYRIAARHGFEDIVEPVRLSPWERVHRFGENILYWLLTLACHSGRARPNKFWRSRQLIYLSRRTVQKARPSMHPSRDG
jgi:hypothetical protein